MGKERSSKGHKGEVMKEGLACQNYYFIKGPKLTGPRGVTVWGHAPPGNFCSTLLYSIYSPLGDYTYAELDAIRAKKAQERAKRFGVDEQYLPQHPQPQMTFDPNLGFSNGGIMETRIGAVGGKARDHIPPEASAHMY